MINPNGTGERFSNYKQALEHLEADPISVLYVYGDVLKLSPESIPRETLRDVIKSAQIRMHDRLNILLCSGDLPEYDGVGKKEIKEIYELTRQGDWTQDTGVFEQFLERTSRAIYGDYKRPNWLSYLMAETT